MDSQHNKDRPHKQIALADEQLHQLAAYDGSRDAFQEPDVEDVINLRDYWRVIVQRKGTVLTFCFMVLFATLVATFLMTPIYRSSATLQIETESAKVVEYDGVTPEESSRGKDFYETQYELLKSRTLARRVIDQLGLESSKQFNDEGGQVSFFKELANSFKSALAGEGDALEVMPQDIETLFLEDLTVKPIQNSRLVLLHYDSPDKQLAADVVNAISKNFINTTLERRFEASSYAKTFLAEQLKQVRANLEDSERRLVAYAKEREIIDLDQKQGVLMHQVKGLSQEITKAESRRIEAESEFREMQTTGGQGFLRILESPVIQRYKETLANLESEYEEKLRTFKPAYPKMLQLKSQINEVQKNVDDEIHNIQTAINAQYNAAVREEAMLKVNMADLKAQILDLQNRSTDYQALKRDVDTNRNLYDGLLQRMKEVGVAAGIGTNNISVVDPGEVARRPLKPDLTKNILLALVLGLFGGIGLAFLFEHLDDTIKSGSDLEKQTGLALLGIIPELDIRRESESESNVALYSHAQPKSAIAEAYRSCRTALTFSTTSGAPKLLHITSSAAGEGKTTTAINIATAFTQTGGNVLLIDADLRNPSLHKELSLPNAMGLTNFLAGDKQPAEVVKKSEIPKLYVMPTGPIPPNPAELLSTGKMMDMLKMSTERFEYVIVDGPPVLGLADALILANMARATIMVVDAGVTRTGALEGALKRLKGARANILGTVLAKYGQGGSGYGYDYHYSYDYYSYAGDEDEGDEEPRKQLAS